LLIDIAVDDPQAYTAPFKTQRKYILKPSWNIMEFICEDTQASFDEFEKKVGTKGTKAAEVASESGSSQSIVGDWKGTITLADGRSLLAAFSFSASSNGSLTVADPSVSMNLQFRNVAVSAEGTITGVTSDQVNFLGKLSADGKQMVEVYDRRRKPLPVRLLDPPDSRLDRFDPVPCRKDQIAAIGHPFCDAPEDYPEQDQKKDAPWIGPDRNLDRQSQASFAAGNPDLRAAGILVRDRL